MMVEEETFDASRYLIDGVLDQIQEWLFKTKEWNTKQQLYGNIDDAIHELESWQEIIIKGGNN